MSDREALDEVERVPVPPGKPQGGMKSDAGRAAYWRMQWESAVGALADLIAENTENYERAEAAEQREADLRRKVAAIEALHRPIRVYDECEHDADHGCDPVEVYDYMGCSESMIGWGCSVCCYDDESPREDCPHGAVHRGVDQSASCPTHAALATEPDGSQS